MADPEVKARLSIEQDGEPQVFREAAASVSELGTSASGAAPSLEGLITSLEELGRSAEGTEAAKAAVAEFAQSLRDLSGAESLEEQREGVEAALDAWQRMGNEIPEVLESSSAAARDFQATLERLLEIQRGLADPLTQSLGRAEEAFASLNASVEGNMSGVNERLAQARRRLDEYRDALDQARRAGQNISAGQEQELARLEARYASATTAVGRYAAAKRTAAQDIDKASAATTNEAGSINSLDELLARASPRWAGYVKAAGAVIATFSAAYAAGLQLRDALNALTDGGFDRGTQAMFRMSEAADVLVDGLDRAARSAETLANQRALFEKLGLEGFTTDVEKNAAALETHARSAKADKDEVAKLKEEQDKLTKALGVNREELDKQAGALAQVMASFAEQNKQLGASDLSKIFGPMIQKLLDSYSRLKAEVPPALAAIASSWNITTTAASAAAARHRQIIDSLVQDITGVTRVSREALNTTANDLLNALSKLNLFKLDSEQFERAQAHVRSLVEAYTAAGESIPPELAKVAAQLRIFQAESDVAAQRTRAAAIAADEYGSAVLRAGESTLRASKDLDSGRVAIAMVAPASQEAQISLSDLMAKYGEAGRAAQKAGEDARAGTGAAAAGAAALGEASSGFKALGDSAATAGEQVSGAGQKIEETATRVAELGQIDADLTKPASEIERIASGATALNEVLSGLLESFGKFSSLGSIFGGLFGELERLISLAGSARSAIAALTGGEGGSDQQTP